jgi:fluoroacetyl-CoA thioesterase
MQRAPKIGDTAEIRFVVDRTQVIEFADDQMPAVLSTPALIGVLERTARTALAPLLAPNERTVGVQIEVRHLAPTGLGEEVVCQARVIHVEGKLVTFQIEARDGHERIARGLHRRAVIRTDRFAARLKRKQATRRDAGAATS